MTSTIGFGYDEANNRIYEDQTISGLPTRRVQTDADADGNRTDLLVKTGNTVNFATYFDYTSRNELLNIYDSGHTAFFKYSYDPAGDLTQRLGQRSRFNCFTYDAINRPITCAQNGSNGANFATSHYDYDKLGNFQDTYRDEEGGKGERFGYNPFNQVSSVVYSATNVTSSSPTNPAKSVSYSVSNRNRKTMTVTDNSVSPSVTTTTTYNNVDLNQISSIQVNGNPAQTVSWDSNMNLNGYSGWGYSYDAENRLISVSGNGHYASFIYDGVGRCVKRSIDGATTVFTFDQWTPVMEWDGSGNWLATNIYGLGDDELVYRLVGSWYWFVKSDPMGNVKFLLDAYGNGIEKYKYDAFGQPTITDWSGNARANSAFGNRFMFSGRDYMSSLALYDMRNRIYDPGMGRFYQLDPIGFDGDPLNQYRFSGNNPLLGGDPAGLLSFSDVIGAISDFADDHPIAGFFLGTYTEPSGSSDAATSASWWNDAVDTSTFSSSAYATDLDAGHGAPADAFFVLPSGTSFETSRGGISIGSVRVSISPDIHNSDGVVQLNLGGVSTRYFSGGSRGMTHDTPLGDMIALAGGLKLLKVAESAMGAGAIGTEERRIAVIGSRNAIKEGGYAKNPTRYNVFDVSGDSTKPEIDRANAEWVNAAARRGDEFLAITNPETHEQWLRDEYGEAAYWKSNYLHLELPMLEQYKTIVPIIKYR